MRLFSVPQVLLCSFSLSYSGSSDLFWRPRFLCILYCRDNTGRCIEGYQSCLWTSWWWKTRRIGLVACRKTHDWQKVMFFELLINRDLSRFLSKFLSRFLLRFINIFADSFRILSRFFEFYWEFAWTFIPDSSYILIQHGQVFDEILVKIHEIYKDYWDLNRYLYRFMRFIVIHPSLSILSDKLNSAV